MWATAHIKGSYYFKKPIFGASPLQIHGEDASRLVGGIVEKGFSTPSSAPRPSVLPFPVARHRSHGGPRWTPVGGGVNSYDDDEEEDEEIFGGFDSSAAFAKPVQRKDKKGLDFTRWRDVIAGGDSSGVHKLDKDNNFIQSKKPKNASKLVETSHRSEAMDEDKDSGQFGEVKEQKQDVSDMAIDVTQKNIRADVPAAEHFVQMAETSRNAIAETREDMFIDKGLGLSEFPNKEMGNEIEGTSLEGQIDGENRARLGRMSSNEIAEAQAEIMARMSPALIEVLKKRGQDKLKKKKWSGSDTAATGEVKTLQDGSALIDAPAFSHGDSSDAVMKTDAKEKWRDQGNDSDPQFIPKNSSLWDSWSKRVENVREIRFSLDGSIVKSDFAKTASTGRLPAQSEFTANNVAQRDFLRTEGDPGAAGYTIKEAVALTRSVVPGQRALALHIIAAILNSAINSMYENKVGYTLRFAETDGLIDWEAIWAFALGPEPELALSLRICLDDNHNSVVLACAKVFQSMLSFDMNENFFDTSEKAPPIQVDVYTAAVFRSKPDIDVGFLHGGFWKYSAKPSNIFSFPEGVQDKPEGEHTIQDDVIVSGQDVAAGLVRMGILPRICYLLETQPSTSLEECLLSIVIALARHSPICATAIMKCHRLVQTVVVRFTSKEEIKINPPKIKSVILLKVLARLDKKNCLEFIKNGIFQKVTWHLVRYASLDQWMKSGRESCKLSSTLLVEQLRLWKVCIAYGCCVSYFVDLFPALRIWLNVPSFQKLVEYDVLSEFAAISKEAYLVLEALTKRLPNFYSPRHQTADVTAEEMETWCWSHVGPLVDLALDWMVLKDIAPISRFFDRQNRENEDNMLQDSTICSLLWVISSVMHMISSVLEAVIPVDTSEFSGGCLPWLPEFVPKIGLKLIKNRYFCYSGVDVSDSDCNLAGGGCFFEFLFQLRYKSEQEMSMATASCLQGLVQIVVSVDKLILLANPEINNLSSQYQSMSREDKILADGMLQSSLVELRALLTTHTKFAFRSRNDMQSIEMFGRGGPAPGVGVGWGASGGGFWSKTVLLAQVDARLITCLLELFQTFFVKDPVTVENLHSSMQRINTALETCLTAGPRDRSVVDKLFDLLFQVPVLKCLEFGIDQFLRLNDGLKVFGWNYRGEEYQGFCAVLVSHFKSRWLSVKKKSKSTEESQNVGQKMLKKGNVPLETIYEEIDASFMDNNAITFLTHEWSNQRLPLPQHWFLSPISTVHHNRDANFRKVSSTENFEEEQAGLLTVAQGGLFFLLGLEAMSAFLSPGSHSSVQNVSVVWKLHALSVTLVNGTGVLEDEKSRDVYETLQSVYGQEVDKLKLAEGERTDSGLLQFQSEVNESYSTFIEMLVEQFAAVSYGDLVFGRQISVYLHRRVEASVRLATWNALSNARALELLPPLEKCFSKADGYLEPIEDGEKLLEAYAKSWISGALDKAASRRSVSYILVLHHLSSFIFGNCIGEKLLLRNQLIKSLLRDYSRKVQHQGMMMNLLRYKEPTTGGFEEACEVEKRLQLLRDACGGSSSLLNQVERLDESMKKEESADSGA
ncbi:hypothetical protein ACH5RR_002485 [Cinchona calisaya]|uniref:Transcriptional elongation regulator MINIYO n=1 Tax=Cinchona calisaya TaxID=153742 RepID=A0ABD3B7Q0_9GENT